MTIRLDVGSHRPYQINTLKELYRIAGQLGCELVVAKPWELLLDLDQYEGNDGGFLLWRDTYRKVLEAVAEKFGRSVDQSPEAPEDLAGPLSYEHWRSRNGHLHVKVLLGCRPYRGIAVALQASLGSDPLREALACWEANQDSEEDTRSLFRPKVGSELL